MRNYVIYLLILIPILSFGNLLSSKVKHVTVFHLGSEIVHEIDVNLKKGNNTIQVKGVSNRIIEKTTQIIASDFLLINCKKVKSIETNNRQDDQIKVYEDELKIMLPVIVLILLTRVCTFAWSIAVETVIVAAALRIFNLLPKAKAASSVDTLFTDTAVE